MRLLFSLAGLTACSVLMASTPIELNRELREARSIVLGHTEAKRGFYGTDGEIYTEVTFRVDAALKDGARRSADGASITLIIPGGEVDDVGVIDSTAPLVGDGEPVLLLLDDELRATRGFAMDGDTVPEINLRPGALLALAGQSMIEDGMRLPLAEFKKAHDKIEGYAAATPLAATVSCYKLIGPKWANRAAAFRFDGALPPVFLDPMRRATASWTNAGSQFRFNEDAASNNVVNLTPIASATILAQTRIWYQPSTNSITSFTLSFNSNRAWGIGEAGKFDIEGVGAHELGHALGLDHPGDASCSEQTMWASAGVAETKKRSLEAGDKEGAVFLYTAGGTVTPPPPPPPAAAVPAPVLTQMYVYPRATAGRTMYLVAMGSAFDTTKLQFVVKGGTCPAAGCVIPTTQLFNLTSTQAYGAFWTGVPGTFTFQLRNGATGPVSAATATFTAR